MMDEIDVIGLQSYDSFYMQKTGRPLLACLLLKPSAQRDDGAAQFTDLVCTARIYFTGDLICSPAMLQVFKREAILCKSGFPVTSGGTASVAKTTTSAYRRSNGAQPASTTCKIDIPAAELRSALKNFMCGEGYDGLVCDERKTQGNGLGFRAMHNEGNCVALLYLLRNNVMLMEQPLFGAHAKGMHCDIGPSSSLFILDVTILRTFMGLSNDTGLVGLAFKECHTTGEQVGTLSYHRKHESDPVYTGSVFTASVSMTPVGT